MSVSTRVEIRREDTPSLAAYAAISVAYEVREVLRTPAIGQGAILRTSVPLPYWKDYDAIPGNHPRDWPARFAVDRARFFVALSGVDRVGGAVVVVEPSDVTKLGGDEGFALLWDLRVAPEARRRGVGRALLAAAEASVTNAGIAGIVAETQDINVAACRLYNAAGYEITRVHPNAYPGAAGEARIMWTKQSRLRLSRRPT